MRGALVTILAATVLSACQTALVGGYANDPEELLRTWNASHVYLPANGLEIPDAVELAGPTGSPALRLDMMAATVRGDFDRIPVGRTYPVIIYMHGCTGIAAYHSRSGAYLAGELGVAVIQPASFARNYRPSNCNPATKSGGMFRQAIQFRVAEANFAIREARKLHWIDRSNVFLMGHSEGGITASKFTGESVNARIVEGATCHYGWNDWSGLNAPESEPVLSLLGADDPWQRGKPWQGKHCGLLMSATNGSRSIVVVEGEYADRHDVLFDIKVRKAVATFISARTRQ